MDILTTSLSLTLIMISSLYWGEVLSIHLPEISKKFDRKPFNCRPCFTFHLTWILSAITALILFSAFVAIAGVGIAFILFFITRTIDNKKITK